MKKLILAVLLVAILAVPSWGALEFDGVDQYVDSNTAFATPVTLSLWFKSDVAADAGVTLIGIVAPTDNDKFYFGFQSSTGNLGIGIGDSTWNNESGGYKLDTAWHYYAFTYDGTTAYLYVDTLQKATKTNTTSTVGDYYIGATMYWDGPIPVSWADGHIADARIYNRALTPNEIQTIYYGEGRDGITEGLVCNPDFAYKPSGQTAASGDTVRDKSPEANHGTARSSGATVLTYVDSPF